MMVCPPKKNIYSINNFFKGAKKKKKKSFNPSLRPSEAKTQNKYDKTKDKHTLRESYGFALPFRRSPPSKASMD